MPVDRYIWKSDMDNLGIGTDRVWYLTVDVKRRRVLHRPQHITRDARVQSAMLDSHRRDIQMAYDVTGSVQEATENVASLHQVPAIQQPLDTRRGIPRRPTAEWYGGTRLEGLLDEGGLQLGRHS